MRFSDSTGVHVVGQGEAVLDLHEGALVDKRVNQANQVCLWDHVAQGPRLLVVGQVLKVLHELVQCH